MPVTTTSIRIDVAVRKYGKKAAFVEGFTFMAYYENLILNNLKTAHPELYEEYMEGRDDKENEKPLIRRSKLLRAQMEGKNIIDTSGKVFNKLEEF